MEDNNRQKIVSSGQEIAVDPNTVNTTYELFVVIITFLSLVSVTVLLIIPLPEQVEFIILQINFVVCILFLFDFLRSLIQAKYKLGYLRWGWMDLLGGIPFLPPAVYYVRLARIVRGVRRIRKVRAAEIRYQFTGQQAQTALLSTTLIALIVVFFASVLVLNVESQTPGGNIVTGDDALWWALVTISTVGYGDLFPVSETGRFIAGIVIIVGVALYSVIVSFLASKFVDQGQQYRDQLSEIKAELADVKKMLNERQPPEEGED